MKMEVIRCAHSAHSKALRSRGDIFHSSDTHQALGAYNYAKDHNARKIAHPNNTPDALAPERQYDTEPSPSDSEE